ncbi:hypothetical protein LP420_20360 [Massilia sp. B-10]|nr:hypothetical protein LP420_20360 [Massilia sp. B-10]
MRDAMATIRTDYPLLFAQSEQRLAALFRRILPVKLALVTEWGEEPLMEQATLLQPMTELVRKFAEMEVLKHCSTMRSRARGRRPTYSASFSAAPHRSA